MSRLFGLWNIFPLGSERVCGGTQDLALAGLRSEAAQLFLRCQQSREPAGAELIRQLQTRSDLQASGAAAINNEGRLLF